MNFAQRKRAAALAKAKGLAQPITTTEAAGPVFVPEFLPQAAILNMNGDTVVNRSILNMNYFATEATAQEMLDRFGGDHLETERYGGENGPGLVTDPPGILQQIIVWKNGYRANAGLMAAYYKADRNPEDLFPGLADKLVRMQLAADMATFGPIN